MAERNAAPLAVCGVGIVYDTVGAVFGGLGPFIVATLIARTGNPASAAWWAAALGAIGAVAVLCLRRATTAPPGGDVPRRLPSAA